MGCECASTFSAQDTNTNDAANGTISCVFYDIQRLGMYQSVGDILPLLVHLYLLTVTLLHMCYRADWSTEGCEMVLQDAETATCACNHLTAFSILQVQRQYSMQLAHTHTHTHTHTHARARAEHNLLYLYLYLFVRLNPISYISAESSCPNHFNSACHHIGSHPIYSGWGSVPCPGHHRSGLPTLECVHVSNTRVAQRTPHIHDTHSAIFRFPCIHIVHVQESPKVTRR